MILKKKKKVLYWPPRPYKRYKAIKGLERPGGGPRERYLRVLEEALKVLIRALRALYGP